MDFLEMINEVGKRVQKHDDRFVPMTSMDQKFADSNFDSLDMLMIIMYICTAYEIPNKTAEGIFPLTPLELEHSINLHKTRTPESLQEVLDLI